MACHMLGANPLPEPVRGYQLIGPWGTRFSKISIKIQAISLEKMQSKMLIAKRWPLECPWTHLALVPHMVKWVTIGSDNGLLPVQCQAIAWNNAHSLSIGSLRTDFSEIRIKIENCSFKEMHLKTSAKWWPFCPGRDEFKSWYFTSGTTS